AKQHLKIDFRLEGNPFSHLTARNFHAFPTGPSPIESIDIDQLYVDYDLLGFARHGLSRLFENVEARSARIVLNPSKAPLRTRPPRPQLKLPRFFPERLRLTNATLVVRNQPDDFVAEGIDLDLDPRHPGELRIERLQLPSGDNWSKLSGQTSYANKNLVFLVLPEDYLSGEIEHLTLDGTGVIDAPRTWSGRMSVQMTDVHRPEIHFDRGVVEISAGQGRAILHSAEIVRDVNNFHLHGAIELPATFEEFGRTPTTLEISGTAPDLERLTAGTPVGLTGSAQFNGRIEIANAEITAALGVTAETVGFSDGIIDKLNCTLRASKRLARPNARPGSAAPATEPWFADLRTAMDFGLTGIRYRDYIVDSAEGTLNESDDTVGLDRLNLRRNQNELNVRGRY